MRGTHLREEDDLNVYTARTRVTEYEGMLFKDFMDQAKMDGFSIASVWSAEENCTDYRDTRVNATFDPDTGKVGHAWVG